MVAEKHILITCVDFKIALWGYWLYYDTVLIPLKKKKKKLLSSYKGIETT